ncbi:dapk-1 [Symbiodinium sp. KB8]|nr:dapk-1 [Symbiodinium sp. KB8]
MIESLALGLSELHSAGILHCDVKPDNVVLHSPRPGSAQLWLIDFGDARLVDEPSSWRTQRPGDPSVACHPDVRSGAFSPATDAWCLAQAAAWIWQGWEPWNPAHLDDAMPLQQMLYRCLAWQPEDRPSLPELSRSAATELNRLGGMQSRETLIAELLPP